MFRNVKACKRLVAMLLPLFLISAFLAFQTSSGAQTSGCPGNILQNGDFATGVIAVGSGNFPPSTVPNWSLAFGTPQIVASMGCGTPNFTKMWGNKVVGEAIKQTVNIQAGHTYTLSACVSVDTSNPILPKYVRFNVRASNGPLATYTTAAPVIGLTPIITSTTWTPVTLPNWTAPTNFDTITINPENDNVANDGNTVSWGWIDNICLQDVSRTDFKADSVCQGQPTTFTSGASGATSWSWDFNDGTNSTQQNPTHVYATSGTFNVKHCINGSSNCVTKPVTVKAAPPVPVITGPNNVYGGQTATYSASPSTGVSYSWIVNNGTIVGPNTGVNVDVTWNGSGGGSIGVIITNKAGCSSSTKMAVGSDLFLGECCHAFQSKTDLMSFNHAGGGVYDFTPALSINLPNIIRVTANVISSSSTFTPAACGTAGPVNSHVMSAANVGSLVASVPISGGHEVIWHGPPMNVNGVNFPMKIKFPPPPTGKCRDTLTFCIKYTFTSKECKTCEVIRCYGPFKRGGPIDTFEDTNNINLTP